MGRCGVGERLYKQTETDEIVGTATASIEVILAGLAERFPAPRTLRERWQGAVVVSRMLAPGSHLLLEPLVATFAPLGPGLTRGVRPAPVLYVAPDVWEALLREGKVRRG
jgi:hypothetical protein